MEPRIAVSEIFGPTIQGEGALAGAPALFLRTWGCPHACTWCDTKYAVEGQDYRFLTVEEIVRELRNLPYSDLLVLTGGDPVLWKDHMTSLIPELIRYWHIHLETQASLPVPEWVKAFEPLSGSITLSPKPPSANQSLGYLQEWLDLDPFRFGGIGSLFDCVKIVVADDIDLQFAIEVFEKVRPSCLKVLQPVTRTPETLLEDYRVLVDKVLTHPEPVLHQFKVRVLPQLHKLLWPEALRGRQECKKVQRP